MFIDNFWVHVRILLNKKNICQAMDTYHIINWHVNYWWILPSIGMRERERERLIGHCLYEVSGKRCLSSMSMRGYPFTHHYPLDVGTHPTLVSTRLQKWYSLG